MNEENNTTPVEKPSKKSNTSMFISVGVILVFSMLYIIYRSKTKIAETQSVTPTLTQISLAEIAVHNTRDDCWTTINGGVYDVTNFTPNHKGKEKILNACGVDATDFFTGKHPTIGRVHSAVAVKLLETMKIGTLRQQ
ncbi:MAG: cytochrome b5-like heme/steroid binding domain-containing protein [Patescibacteria group bacterium]